MKCREICKQLTAYLDNEVSPSEKKLIQAHLASCQNCQVELERLGDVRDVTGQYLHTQAAEAVPSPQAWTVLKASLPSSPPKPSMLQRVVQSISFPGKLSLEGLTTQRIAIILVFLIVLLTFTPPVWARIEPFITNWFSFASPDDENEAAIGGFTAFTPYHATYLPEDFRQSLLGSTTSFAPEFESIEIGYDSGDQFLILVESSGPGVNGLPEGQTSWVHENPAIFISPFATSRADLVDKKPGISTVIEYSYENTNLLTWFIGEIKIEIFSNLPLDEMLKVAESLEPMQGSEGENPLDLP
jgi:hypothetical protein